MLENIFHLLNENNIKRLFNRAISPSLHHDIVKCKFREMIKFWILLKKKGLPNTKNIETSVVQFKIFTHQVLQLGPEKWKSKHHLYTCESTRFRRTSTPQFHWQTVPIDSTSLPCISQWHGDQNRQMQGKRKQLLLDATWSQHRDFKKTVLETEMFSWFWNAHWTLEPFTFSKLVQLMYLQCYLEIQPRRVCQSHVTPCVQFGFYCTHGVFVNLLFTVSWLIWIRQCHRYSEHLHCKRILFRQ